MWPYRLIGSLALAGLFFLGLAWEKDRIDWTIAGALLVLVAAVFAVQKRKLDRNTDPATDPPDVK